MKSVIVLSWIENTGIRFTGRQVLRDGNWFEEYEACPQAKACVFSRNLSEVQRARDYARSIEGEDGKEHIRIDVVHDSGDVLEKMRRFALKMHSTVKDLCSNDQFKPTNQNPKPTQ